jgi:hypothetical protein
MVSLGHYVANCWLDTLPKRKDKIQPTDKAQLSGSQDGQTNVLSNQKRLSDSKVGHTNHLSYLSVGHTKHLSYLRNGQTGQKNQLSYSRVGQNGHLSFSKVGQCNHEEICVEYFPQEPVDIGAITTETVRPRENSWDVWCCRNCFCLPFNIDISRCRSINFFKSKSRQVYVGDVS